MSLEKCILIKINFLKEKILNIMLNRLKNNWVSEKKKKQNLFFI